LLSSGTVWLAGGRALGGMVSTYGRSANVTFSAISATLLAILPAMISKGEAPFIACGTGGVALAAAAVFDLGAALPAVFCSVCAGMLFNVL
jgi:hypothetical protein